MPASFLHGVETIYQSAGGASVTDVPSAVIALVGTAGMGLKDEPILITSDVAAAATFGSPGAGYTIPSAIKAIFDHGGASVIVVNVAAALAVVAPASYTFDATDVLTMPKKMISTVVVTNAAATTTYVAGIDYTVDGLAGKITRVVGGTIPALTLVKVTFSWVDPSTVLPADIIGGISVLGKRQGMQAFLDSTSKYGFAPTIIIAPGYSTLVSVSAAMIVLAELLKAQCLIDAPIGTTRDQALAGRNGTAPVANFNTSSVRAMLCYPYLKAFDPVTGLEGLEPFSQRLAGVMAKTDSDLGFWFSPSNKEILGITGVETRLNTSFTDPLSDSNLLNAAGIITYLQTYGGGIRSWGNRSAGYPTITTVDNFVAVQRVRDIIAKGIRRASLQFIDRPINRGLIDAIRLTILGYFTEKTIQGALLPGSQCLFLAADNPPTSITAGRLIFTTVILPPPPAERITDKQVLDISLAAALVA